MCVLRWILSGSRCVNPLLQCVQLYGFCPECVIKCRYKISFCAKLFWQISHWNGLSPVWILSWRTNAERVGNHFSHIPQLKPLCCMCTEAWRLNWILRAKDLGHCGHLNIFSSPSSFTSGTDVPIWGVSASSSVISSITITEPSSVVTSTCIALPSVGIIFICSWPETSNPAVKHILSDLLCISLTKSNSHHNWRHLSVQQEITVFVNLNS